MDCLDCGKRLRDDWVLKAVGEITGTNASPANALGTDALTLLTGLCILFSFSSFFLFLKKRDKGIAVSPVSAVKDSCHAQTAHSLSSRRDRSGEKVGTGVCALR